MRCSHALILATLVFLVVPAVNAQQATPVAQDDVPLWLTPEMIAGMDVPGAQPPLPRYREGGRPEEPGLIEPYAIHALRDEPTSGFISSPAEYEPVRGVLFNYVSSQWPTVVRDLVVALTADPDHDEIAYVVVANSSQQQSATNLFVAGGADMSKVAFIIQPTNALWIRDYGPHFIFQDGALAIVDSDYYPTRPLDNFTPSLLGDQNMRMPTYDMGLYYSGGNFQPGPNRMAVMSSLVTLDNPYSAGFDTSYIAQLFDRFQGIDTVHIFQQLPFSVDGTGHIDMWMYLVDEDDVIISQFKAGSDPTAIAITNNAVPYMQNLGFTVRRPWAWVSSAVHYTYTNAFRVNDRIFIPEYGAGDPSYRDEDVDARGKFQAAAGVDVEIIPINCYSIIPAAGAIHCIVMQVPRCTEDVPQVHVVHPQGGECFVAGTYETIQWAATDTDNEDIPQIDLYYSLDDGNTWEWIATTTNTGEYDWMVPDTASPTALVKVVATSADTDLGEAVSSATFDIVKATQTVYDFTTGASSDKFGWGYRTSSWSQVSHIRHPVTSEISTLVSGAYGKIDESDATGGTSDPNRYIAPNPPSGYESTHTFEFTIAEDPATIGDLGILWEGYADACTQIELYIWDYEEGDWCNGKTEFGQNRCVDNWAGNVDAELVGHMRQDLDRFIDTDGELTLLLYTERGPSSYVSQIRSLHDYVKVTVTTVTQTLAADMNCDDIVDFRDINPFVLALGQPEVYESQYPDCYLLNGDINGDGELGFDDINPFVLALTGK